MQTLAQQVHTSPSQLASPRLTIISPSTSNFLQFRRQLCNSSRSYLCI